MVKSVDSWPPCKELVEVKQAAGLPIKSPESQMSLAWSIKYFKGAAILPNRVGLPIIKPLQNLSSSRLQYKSPCSGMPDSQASVLLETAGTVLTLQSIPDALLAPKLIS